MTALSRVRFNIPPETIQVNSETIFSANLMTGAKLRKHEKRCTNERLQYIIIHTYIYIYSFNNHV